MNSIKISISLLLSLCLQSISYCVKATPPPEAYYTKTTKYNTPDKYCFPQGEWNGDLSKSTLSYTLIVPPKDQTKYGDVFLGFRQPSAPDKIWLYGSRIDSAGFRTKPGWFLHDEKHEPVEYSFGQRLPATTAVHILDQPRDLRQFEGDGEILVGYGLRKDDSSTSPSDSFKEMLDNNRFISAWKADAQQSTRLGGFICVKFTEMTQRIEGVKPSDKIGKK